jgi:hypothetical protein
MYRFYFALSAVMLAALVAALMMKSDVAGPALLLFLITLVMAVLQYGVDTHNIGTYQQYSSEVAAAAAAGGVEERQEMNAIQTEPTYWIYVGVQEYQVSKRVSWIVAEIVATLDIAPIQP